MEWTVRDSHPSFRINDKILHPLKDHLKKTEFKCQVVIEPVSFEFWTKPVKSHPPGYCGPIGDVGPPGRRGDEPRPNAEPKKILVQITFPLPSEIAENVRDHQLKLTKNHREETHPCWSVSKIFKNVSYRAGLYKKSGFDEAYTAIKKLKPRLTEIAFAQNDEGWDEDLVEIKLFCGHDQCLEILKASCSVETGESSVTLSLLACDVLQNLDYIITILS